MVQAASSLMTTADFMCSWPTSKSFVAAQVRVGDAGRRRIAVEHVFEVVVILGDVLSDDVRGRARRHRHHFQPSGPRFERQDDLADVARDHRVDVILRGGALEGAHRLGGGGMVVVSDDLDLAAVDAAGGVDLIGGELRGLWDRGAGDRGPLRR